LNWADGGPTALHNLVLLCDHHHDRVHAQDWQIRIVNGRAEFTPPSWLGHTDLPLRNTVHQTPTPLPETPTDGQPGCAHPERRSGWVLGAQVCREVPVLLSER